MEYIREKHYSVALIRIKELEKKLDKLIDYVREVRQDLIDNLEAGEFDPAMLKIEIDKTSKLLAEVKEDRHVKKVNS